MTARRQAVRLIALLTAGYALYACVAVSNQTHLVFPGRLRPPVFDWDLPGGRLMPGMTRLSPRDKTRQAVLFRADRPDATLVIVAHGNGEQIGDWLTNAMDLRHRGFNVLLVEYPGYGGLPGEPGQESIRAAFEAGYDAALAELATTGPRPAIIGFGYSIGSAVIADLSRSRPLDAMVLYAPFRSLGSMAARRGLPPALVRDPFDTLDAVRRFDGPVTVIHGLKDTTIPPDEGRAVAAAAHDGEFVAIPDEGHNDGLRDWDAFVARLMSADARARTARGTRPATP